MRTAAAAALVALLASSPARAEIPGAQIVLDAAPGTPGSDPSSAPHRFVLLKDGQVFVGGTRLVDTGRLEKAEAQALRKRAEQARKLPGVTAGPLTFGGDPARTFRLRLLQDDPVEITGAGDPAAAPPELAPVATLVAELLRFDHPTLRPWSPASYVLTVREARLPGGCRAWGFTFPIAQAREAPRVVSAVEASGWSTGAVPASVCGDDGRRYAVTLRPLLPGERP